MLFLSLNELGTDPSLFREPPIGTILLPHMRLFYIRANGVFKIMIIHVTE